MKITIGDYLLQRLKELGIRHVIGVPGDFNLQFLEQMREDEQIEFVGMSDELNAAYAADGYAREHGISALVITYGVGDLGAIGGIAGAASEHVPMLVISGAPPLYAKRHNFQVHHSLADGDFSNIENCYEEFTCYRTTLTHENAQAEIDQAIVAALRHGKPVNIQMPSNLSYLEIDIEDKPLPKPAHTSDAERLESCVEKMVKLFERAKNPAVLIDQAVDRLQVSEEMQAFVDKTRTPFAAMTTGKAILEENQALFLGNYAGDASGEGVQEKIEGADFLLTVAPRFIENNSGNYSAKLPEASVILHRHYAFVEGEPFEGVAVEDVLQAFLQRVPEQKDKRETPADRVPSFDPKPDKKLVQADFWKMMQGFLRENDLVYGETGTASHGVGTLRFPKGAKCITSLFWGAIGFTLPALFGSLLANPRRRQILFIGDGSFQVTAQAFSRILYHEMNPIIFLINNDGYTIERFIMGMDADYNEIPHWSYHALPEVWTKENRMQVARVHTQGDLQKALAEAEDCEHGILIEVHMDKEDAPLSLHKGGPRVAEFNYGPRGPKNRKPAEPKDN